MDREIHATHLAEFRQQVYQTYNNRADTPMELLDALRGNRDAQTAWNWVSTWSFVVVTAPCARE